MRAASFMFAWGNGSFFEVMDGLSCAALMMSFWLIVDEIGCIYMLPAELLSRRLEMTEDALSSKPSRGLLNSKPKLRQCQTISVVIG